MWTISKQFDFCYGHRVHNQKLNEVFSLDNTCACRHIHGHQGTINVSLKSVSLINGMVTDFKHLNWFKKWLDCTLDHKFIMDINDPLLRHEVPLLFEDKRVTPDFFKLQKESIGKERYWIISNNAYYQAEQCLQEKYEGIILVDFVPTSENLSKWLFKIVTDKMQPLNVAVSAVQFYETPKSQSIYTE